ncbi:MAG: GNAT family N-acetyltransferase [Flavobacteriaceae bacterium]|nr:GNAT family N-acetyltransferase [Flavobacteriaceae bacterium]
MIEIVKYNMKFKGDWDVFVIESQKSTFLFRRDFVEYHSNRFKDHSLLFYLKGEIIGALPGNENGRVYHSHQGLTYGGLIHKKISATIVLEMFSSLLDYLKKQEFTKIIYKALPFVFQSSFQQEDLYALSVKGFKLSRRDLSFVIDLKTTIYQSKDRRYRINKSKKNNLVVEESTDFKSYMEIVNFNLQSKFKTTAVHSSSELELLHTTFPTNIKLFLVYDIHKTILGGTVLFLDNDFVHTQYLHANAKGRELNSTEFLVDYLCEHFSNKKYLSFGISTENEGTYLNAGLTKFKEGFGGKGIVHDFYEKELND